MFGFRARGDDGQSDCCVGLRTEHSRVALAVRVEGDDSECVCDSWCRAFDSQSDRCGACRLSSR